MGDAAIRGLVVLSAVLSGRRKATGAKGAAVLLAIALAGGCSHKEAQGWHGYYYDNVLSSSPAQVSGPYDDAPRCVAAMHERLRKAPTTASFTCARHCRTASDGSVENCREVAR